MITKEFYGSLADGREVYRYTLVNKNGMTIKVLNYGGIVTELWTPDRRGGFTDLIGGFDSLDSYLNADGYQGAVIGRWANRITRGQFTLDGVDYQLYTTASTGNHCHGGKVGFNQKIFDVETVDAEETFICMCNGRFYGGGFNPVPEADPTDGMMDVLLVKKVSRLQVAGVIGKYKNGRYKEISHLARYFRTDRVVIRCDKPTPINLDGELRMAETVEFRIAEEKLRFFYPRGLTWA